MTEQDCQENQDLHQDVKQEGKQKLATLMAAGKGLKGFKWPEHGQDLQMRIDRDGRWFHEGGVIERKPLVKLFSTILQRDNHGDYWLVTPAEKGRIDVDDVPFFVVDIEIEKTENKKKQKIWLITSLDHKVLVSEANPLRVEIHVETLEPAPYVLIRDDLEALISRSCFYDLVDLADFDEQIDGSEKFGIWSDGCFFDIGPV